MTSVIRSPRLEIGPVYTSDAPKFACWLNDPEVVRYSEQRHITHSSDTQLDYWYSDATVDPNIVYTIRLNDSAIGSVSAVVDVKNSIANVGIMIGDKTEWRKGYGLEAWKHFCHYLFEEKKIRKIEAGCMSINYPMVKICVRTGMKFEGDIPNHFVYEGKPVSMHLFGKLAP